MSIPSSFSSEFVEWNTNTLTLFILWLWNVIKQMWPTPEHGPARLWLWNVIEKGHIWSGMAYLPISACSQTAQKRHVVRPPKNGTYSLLPHFACQLRSIDVMSTKKANKLSSIPRSILLYESIVDIDIHTSKVSSIISTSISIFDITNPGVRVDPQRGSAELSGGGQLPLAGGQTPWPHAVKYSPGYGLYFVLNPLYCNACLVIHTRTQANNQEAK